MCGLYGVYAKRMGKVHVDIFRRLAFHSLKRGLDAAGIAVATKASPKNRKAKAGVEWFKDGYNAGLVLNNPEAQELLNKKNKVLLMGHNRDATIGDLCVAAAHPFKHKHILGFHNGTIHDTKYRPDDQFVSDSDRLFHNLATKGLTETTQDMGNGHFALTWIDTKQGNLNMVRNLRRPLFTMWDKNKHSMLWASEKEFLEDIAIEEEFEWEDPAMLPIDTLFSINLVNHKTEEVSVQLEKPLSYQSGHVRLPSSDAGRITRSAVPVNVSRYRDKRKAKRERRKLAKEARRRQNLRAQGQTVDTDPLMTMKRGS